MMNCAETPSVLCHYSNEYTRHGECYNDATPSVLCQYFNEYMRYGECYNDATRYELFLWQPGVGEERAYPGSTPARRFNAIGVELFLWRHAYNETFSDGLLKKSATPTALFPTNHMLTQGSLHYRLVTLGYQKRNTYGVE